MCFLLALYLVKYGGLVIIIALSKCGIFIRLSFNSQLRFGSISNPFTSFIPYLESWHMEITEELKQEIKEKEYPIIYYLRDLVESDTQAEVIKNDLGLEGIYSLVTNKEIEGYNLKGNAQIQLSTEAYTKLRGNNIILKSGNQVVKTVEITSQNINFTNIPIGVYQIELENNNYVLDTDYLIISQNQTKTLISDINIK